MPIKTVLVPVLGHPEDEAVLEAAISIAKPNRSHVDVIHAKADPRQIAALKMGEGMGASQVATVVAEAGKAYQDAHDAARRHFDEWCARHEVIQGSGLSAGDGVTATWSEAKDDPAAVVARQGRVADVIIVSRSGHEHGDDAAVVEAALMETGRAVLMVPPGMRHPKVGSLAVAWNGSREAARAIGLAMPLLEVAEKVSVISATSSTMAASEAEAIAASIARHGVAVDTITFPLNGGNLANKLQAEALRVGADALVLGAYSHSRLREFVFGGVTKDVLASSHIPILFTH